jgi:anti-sigma regulatory factor (Ser/Thr protein kinase)
MAGGPTRLDCSQEQIGSLSVELTLPAKPPSVREARRLVVSEARAAGWDGEYLRDIALAVGEACANVVVHAYTEGEPGDLNVTVKVVSGRFVVTVLDRGVGIGRSAQRGGLGLGLRIMQALGDDVDIASRAGGGTSVRMVFDLRLRR